MVEYEYDDSTEEEDNNPTKRRTKHVNRNSFIPYRFYALTKKSYILIVESLKHNFTPSIYKIIIANSIFSKWWRCIFGKLSRYFKEVEEVGWITWTSWEFLSLQQEESHFETTMIWRLGRYCAICDEEGH